jgi:acetyl esterase/lipase
MENFENNVTADTLVTPPQVRPVVIAPPTGRKGRERRVGAWLARAALALCFLAGFYLSVFPSGRATVRALSILPGLLEAAQPPWEEPVAEPITHSQRTLASPTGTVYLDIYAPSTDAPPVPGTREGILLIPGVGDQRKDAQLINFSRTLASSGLVVMDLTTQTLISNRLDAGDEEGIAQAFEVLQRWPGVGANRVGLLGFSAGGPLMCFAAADARVRDKVAFVTLFGGYFDARTLLQTIGRRELTENGETQPWHPVYYPLQVLANTIAPLLPGNDGQMLANAFAPNGSESLSPAQIARLAPSSAAAYHLLAGDEPGLVDANLAALSPEVRALLSSLSPSRVINQIHAPIYLLHDRSDQFVPVSESLEFAAALARLHHPYDFAEFGIFQHVEVRANSGFSQLVGDGLSLLRLASEVMQAGS